MFAQTWKLTWEPFRPFSRKNTKLTCDYKGSEENVTQPISIHDSLLPQLSWMDNGPFSFGIFGSYKYGIIFISIKMVQQTT